MIRNIRFAGFWSKLSPPQQFPLSRCTKLGSKNSKEQQGNRRTDLLLRKPADLRLGPFYPRVYSLHCSLFVSKLSGRIGRRKGIVSCWMLLSSSIPALHAAPSYTMRFLLSRLSLSLAEAILHQLMIKGPSGTMYACFEVAELTSPQFEGFSDGHRFESHLVQCPGTQSAPT